MPVELSVATVEFGIVCPATQFKSEAVGLMVGYAVKKLRAVVLVTMAFRHTAPAPAATV